MVVAKLEEEQNTDALLIMSNNTEVLTALLPSRGSLSREFVKRYLDAMSTFEPNIGMFLSLVTLVSLQ